MTPDEYIRGDGFVPYSDRIRTKLGNLRDKLSSMGEHPDPEQTGRYLAGIAKTIEEGEAELRERKARILANADDPERTEFEAPTGVTVRTIRNPWGPATRAETAPEVRARAMTAVERWEGSDELKEGAAATIERLDTPADMRGVAGHIVRFSDPLYIAAFRKYARDPQTFGGDLTPEERRVWANAREEARAVLQVSGAVLPSPLDPTIVLSSAGVVDPMRGIARMDTTTSDTKRYISSAGSSVQLRC